MAHKELLPGELADRTRVEVFGSVDVTGNALVQTGLDVVEWIGLTLGAQSVVTALYLSSLLSNQTTEPGQFTIYVDKPTAVDNATPTPSAAATTVFYRAVGTKNP
jgi:hypothetical protein